MASLDLTMNLRITLLAHNPAETRSEFLSGLILIGVIGLLFLAGFIFLLRTIWRLLKKERPPK